MAIEYEWDIETVCPDTGDVLDHDHTLRIPGSLEMLVLVRDDDGGRSWAYVNEGRLPGYFSVPEADGEYYETNMRVPARFARELQKVYAA